MKVTEVGDARQTEDVKLLQDKKNPFKSNTNEDLRQRKSEGTKKK